VVLLALFFFLYVGVEIGFAGWIFTYAQAQSLAGQATAAYLTSGFWGAFTLGRLAGIPLGARVRPRWILLVDLLGALGGLALMLARPDSLAALWAGTLALGLFLASIFPTTVTLADRRVGLTGRMTGWIFSGASAGAMTLPWLMGQLFDRSGPESLLWVLAAILLLALGVLGVLQLAGNRR
jgi:FHS family Na+ dependent glucose MFS transporter 1